MSTATIKPGAAGAATDEAPKKKSKKMLFIIIGLVVLLGGGGGAAWFLTHRGGGEHEEAKKEVSKPPVFLPLENFTVNLQNDGEDHYLQVGMTLKVGDEAQVDLYKTNMPEVRSRMLLLLSEKTASELVTPEGKKKLTDDIIATLTKPFSGQSEAPTVSSVFFTSFVIQ